MANQVYDMNGDQVKADSFAISYDSMLNANMAAPITITAGTGAPTFAAPRVRSTLTSLALRRPPVCM